MSVAISIDNVIKRFGKDTIINGLSLDVRPGEFFTLLGPSGCGKTTLLRMIIGFNTIEGGEIKIDVGMANLLMALKPQQVLWISQRQELTTLHVTRILRRNQKQTSNLLLFSVRVTMSSMIKF